MIFSGFLTAVGFVAIAAKISPKFLKIVLGYDWVVDLMCTIGIMFLFAGTGTISGMMIGVTTGLAISMVLFFARKLWAYSVYEKIDGKYVLVDYAGEWTLTSFISSTRGLFDDIPNMISNVKSAWQKEFNVIEVK